MGNGAFNVVNTWQLLIEYSFDVFVFVQMIANLPQKIIRYLEFAGFSGDRVGSNYEYELSSFSNQ